MSTITKVFHSDPGHGWLAVKLKELKDFDITDKVSSFSYVKGKSVYLEEDCDAGLYIEAMKEKGVIVKTRESYREYTPIRNYESYSVNS